VPSVIAVDVGGTSIKSALVDEAGGLARRRAIPTPVADGPDAVVDAIRRAVHELLADDVVAVGVVVPGVVGPEPGVVSYATNLGWRDVALGARLGADLGVPVLVDKDVKATALAERTLGVAHGLRDCLVVAIGTGIAAVAVSGGEVVRGANELAGEIGHICVDPRGEACPCGQRGCAERYASAAAVARRYAARAGVLRPADEVVARLAGDPDAAAVWAEAAEALAAMLASCTLLLDCTLIVLSGGLARAGEALREPVARALAARLAWREPPAVSVSPLARDAGVLGAALLAWQNVRAGAG
jgi:glucokinase